MTTTALPPCIARHFDGQRILCRHPSVRAGQRRAGEPLPRLAHAHEPPAQSLEQLAADTTAATKPPSVPSRGLGDRIAAITTALGVPPCDGCHQRQQRLNRWFPSQWSKQLAKVTFGITAFERPRHLERLVASIRRFYPGSRIIVADNGRQKAALV